MNTIETINNYIEAQLNNNIFKFAIDNSIISKSSHHRLLLNCIGMMSHTHINVLINSTVNNKDKLVFYHKYELFRHYENKSFELFN